MSFSTILESWISNCITEKQIKKIEENNKNKKNISLYGLSDIGGFVERSDQVGSYIVSGGTESNRIKSAAAIAAWSLSKNIPVVIIHENNDALKNKIQTQTSFINSRVFIDMNNRAYDPFYNKDDAEICNLIINSSREKYKIKAEAMDYICGILDFIRSKGILPYSDMVLDCPFEELLVLLEKEQDLHNLDRDRALAIKSRLMRGQNQKDNVMNFVSSLAFQGRNIFSEKYSRDNGKNITDIVKEKGLLMLDIGSSLNDLVLNIVMNEIHAVISEGYKIMLIIDDLSVSANDNIMKIVKTMSNKCLTTLISADVFSMLGADDVLFNSVIGRTDMCFVYGHMGISCNKWSELFGYCDVEKVSRNMGTNENGQWGYSDKYSNSINISTCKELRVKASEIADLKENQLYIIDRWTKELILTTIN